MKYFGNAFDNIVNFRDSPSARGQRSDSGSISAGREGDSEKHYLSYNLASEQQNQETKHTHSQHSSRLRLGDIADQVSMNRSSTPEAKLKEV